MPENKIAEKLFGILEEIDCCTKEQQDLFYSFLENQLELTKIFISKQLDYGPGNIAKFGEIG
ncbi:MAG TPA: hypothetical protein P5539_14240, partial [Mesotoga sp.]|nr:hypothetical protein [Mesotoga sp.]